MFTEEVGIDPRAGDGGAGYRSRVSELVSAGRAFATFEGDQVVFKAEIGALSQRVGQIQGVWVHPAYRGRGWAPRAPPRVAERLSAMGGCRASTSTASTTRPRRAYEKVGFTQIASFATVLF
jgi:predicted GNAT family acetyltransferase